MMEDGSGVINLSALDSIKGFLERDRGLAVVTEVLVLYSPCQPLSEPTVPAESNCQGEAVCLTFSGRHSPLEEYVSFGRHDGSEFHYNNRTQVLSVTYHASHSPPLQTTVHFHCSTNHSVSFSKVLEGSETFEIFVESPCVCPNKCSVEDVGPATVILIIFCISAAAYLILGSCAFRPIRTADGILIFPEDHLWCLLCQPFSENGGRTPRRTYSY
ncbi:uncharacterized protein LOC120536041 [Polypterus senegalus]|uniref:uncharacterized protein LOC120536041 n=1 Tax=Polypterus senegalus TaxID=55291 RepID=UPI001963034C|nr:uncharacterized protein LOC120536041 [Polypterus senegalus]